jgi:hypothetical protein
MSHNIDYWQLATAVDSSPSTNNNTTQILSHESFAPTSSEFITIHNESFTPSSCAVRLVAREKEKKKLLYDCVFFSAFLSLLTKQQALV